ncbi:uncharacterized protein LOC142214219 isoform X1 [Leptodactylus fuscus]|uniref:uncharacterized protein LOC142214219 isoform X1 n=1 Tax=Leptodactylus fuscus TaxID=238119 RepID=UPI003F4EB5EE
MPKKFDNVWTNRIIAMAKEGHPVSVIHKWLESNGVPMSRQSVWYYAKGLQKPRYGVRTKTTPEVRKLVDTLTRENVVLYAKQIKSILKNQHNIEISESSIRSIRRQLRGAFEPTSMNLLPDDRTAPEDLSFNEQNSYSTPNTSSRETSFNPSTREPSLNSSPMVLPSHHLHCCIGSIVEEAVKKALFSVNQVAEDAVKKALSSVNQVVEDAVKKALSLGKPMVPDDNSPSLLPLWDTEHVEQSPSVFELPQDYSNDPSTSTSSSDDRLDHSGATNEAAGTVPLTVMAPISDYTLPVLDATKLNNLRKKACNEPHRFAQLLFKELVPYDLYQTWVHRVNYDGSRGKQALPENLRRAIIKETQNRFIITPDIAKRIKDTLNALLRMPRASRW